MCKMSTSSLKRPAEDPKESTSKCQKPMISDEDLIWDVKTTTLYTKTQANDVFLANKLTLLDQKKQDVHVMQD